MVAGGFGLVQQPQYLCGSRATRSIPVDDVTHTSAEQCHAHWTEDAQLRVHRFARDVPGLSFSFVGECIDFFFACVASTFLARSGAVLPGGAVLPPSFSHRASDLADGC
jgi:hypothetical protein